MALHKKYYTEIVLWGKQKNSTSNMRAKTWHVQVIDKSDSVIHFSKAVLIAKRFKYRATVEPLLEQQDRDVSVPCPNCPHMSKCYSSKDIGVEWNLIKPL